MKKIVLLFMILILTGLAFAEVSLKIVTINVWSGLTYHGTFKSGAYESTEERSFRYGLLVNALRELDADVIGVNEANMLPGFAKKLARDLDLDYIYSVRYGGVRLGQAGFPINIREGEVILAKRYLNLAFTGSRALSGGYAGNFATFQIRDATRVLAGKITVGEQDVYLFTTQWSASEFASDLQLRTLVGLFSAGHIEGQELLERVQDAIEGHEIRADEATKTLRYVDEIAGDASAILMGTFNALPESEEIEALREAGFTDAWSVGGSGEGYTLDGVRNTNIINYFFDEESGTMPRRDRLDYIMHRGEGIRTISAVIALDEATYETHPSDHFALVAHLEF